MLGETAASTKTSQVCSPPQLLEALTITLSPFLLHVSSMKSDLFWAELADGKVRKSMRDKEESGAESQGVGIPLLGGMTVNPCSTDARSPIELLHARVVKAAEALFHRAA